MSFLVDFIEKLQDKPKHERVRIMWLAVFISMLLIFLFWVVSLKHLIGENSGQPLISKDVTNKVDDIKKSLPKNDLKAGIDSLFENSSQTKSPFENKQ